MAENLSHNGSMTILPVDYWSGRAVTPQKEPANVAVVSTFSSRFGSMNPIRDQNSFTRQSLESGIGD
jgi:hypothetical protein